MKHNHLKHSKLAVLLVAAGMLTAAVVATAQPLYWDGGTVNLTTNGDGLSQGGAGNWDNSTQNWDQGSGLPHTAWISGEDAVFGASGITAGSGTVTLNAAITANSVTVNTTNYIFTDAGNTANTLAVNAITNAQAVTISNNIVNATGFTKAGASTLSLYADSPALTGPITVAAGTLLLGSENNTAYQGPAYFESVFIATNAVLKFYVTNGASYSQTISGPGSVIANSGTYNSGITLDGSSTFTGPLSVIQCNLSFNSINDTQPCAVGNGTNVTIGNNSGTTYFSYIGYGDTTSRALTVGGTTATVADILLNNGHGSLVWNGPLLLTTNNAHTFTLSGSYTGISVFGGNIADGPYYNTSFTKSGNGDWLLTGSNTYSGGTTINAGVLLITNDSCLGNPSGAITFVRSSGSVLNGTLDSISNNITLGAGRTIIATNQAQFSVADSNNLYVASYITSTGSVEKVQSSYTLGWVVFMNDTNNYGDFIMQQGNTAFTSVADLGTSSSLGAGNPATGGAIDIINAGISDLRYVGTRNSSTHRALYWEPVYNNEGLTLDCTNTGTIAYLSSSKLVNTNASLTLTLAGSNPGTNTLAQVINDYNTAGSEITSLAKSGSGQWVLTGANTFSGGTTISGGTLTVSSDGNLGTAPASATPNILTINGGTLSASSSFALNANRGIALGPTGTDALGNNAVGAGEMDVAAGQTLTYAGIMANNTSTNSGGLVKGGAGELVLSGVNTYSGDTTVNAGTLALSGSGSIADSTNLVINGGADLNVSGVSGGYTLAASQTLWATNDATGTNNGSLNLGSAALALGYTNGIPALAVTGGAFTLNGNTVSVAVTNGGIPLEAGSYLLIAAAAGGSVAGTVPASVSVSGDVDFTLNAALSIQSGQLYLVLSSPFTPSTNACLASLTLSPALTFTPAFASNTLVYAATEAYGSSPTVTVVNADTTATNELITNGIPAGLLPSGAPSIPLALTLGQTNVVQVLVTAQDGLTTNLYTVNVVEQPSQTPPQLTRSVSGNSLVLTWPQDHLGWRLLVQTNNLSRGISTNGSDWGTVAGSTAITSTNLAIVRTNLNEYYRLVYP